MGSYQYAVSTATAKEESYKALSNIVSKDLEALVTFHVTTYVSDLDTEPQIPLKRTDAESAVIEAIRLNPSEWTIPSLPKAIYQMTHDLTALTTLNRKCRSVNKPTLTK